MAEGKVLLVHEDTSVHSQFKEMAQRLELPFTACTIDEVERFLSPAPQLVLIGHPHDETINAKYVHLMRKLRHAKIPFPRFSVNGQREVEIKSPNDCYAYGNHMSQMIFDVPGIFFSRFGIIDPPAGMVHARVISGRQRPRHVPIIILLLLALILIVVGAVWYAS